MALAPYNGHSVVACLGASQVVNMYREYVTMVGCAVGRAAMEMGEKMEQKYVNSNGRRMMRLGIKSRRNTA